MTALPLVIIEMSFSLFVKNENEVRMMPESTIRIDERYIGVTLNLSNRIWAQVPEKPQDIPARIVMTIPCLNLSFIKPPMQ